jgi:gluconate 5-dehydrogenase
VHSSAPDAGKAFSLDGKVALITGGGTGLGFAMAECFIAAGARVVITGRRTEILERAVARLGPNAAGIEHDVTRTESATLVLTEIREKHGPPTILVNNAGVHLKRALTDTGTEDFRNVLGTHVEGAFAMTRAAVPYMKEACGGSVLFVASMTSLIGMPLTVAYSAAKSAYVGMTRSLATELAPDNIRVNAIAPGWIETPMLEQALAGDPERKKKILGRTPMQRFGTPADIGWCAVYLCSPAAAFINGVILAVDGGASIGF